MNYTAYYRVEYEDNYSILEEKRESTVYANSFQQAYEQIISHLSEIMKNEKVKDIHIIKIV